LINNNNKSKKNNEKKVSLCLVIASMPSQRSGSACEGA
jgi:hypothetical protein